MVTGGYRWLPLVTVGYRWLPLVYRWLPLVTVRGNRPVTLRRGGNPKRTSRSRVTGSFTQRRKPQKNKQVKGDWLLYAEEETPKEHNRPVTDRD